MNIGNVISYFRDCHIHDNKSVSIFNVLGSEVENLQIISDKEVLLNDDLPYFPISDKYAEIINQTLKVYEKEKELCYFSFLLLGTDIVNNRTRKIISPLYIFPASIEQENELNYVSIDRNNQRLNSEIIRELFDEENITEDFNEIISENLSSLEDYNSLGYLLEKYFINLDTTSLVDYPNLFEEKKIKRLMTPSQLSKREGFMIIPASGIGIIRKKGESIGIQNELAEIVNSQKFSDPIRALFTNELIPDLKSNSGKIPNIISEAQKRAISAADKASLSLIVGPPGTGKSYTIATLAIDHITKNKSVLIVSRTDKAVDVVADKIGNELELKNVLVRAGRKQYYKELKTSLQDLLSGVNVRNHNDRNELKFLSAEITTIERTIQKLENDFLEAAKFERKWGLFLSNISNKNSLLQRFNQNYIKWKNKRNTQTWEIIQEIERNLDVLEIKLQKYINHSFELQKSKAVNLHRGQLKLLQQALRARTGKRKENLFSQIDFKILLEAFPVWLVSMKDIYKVLPLQAELFDLAIIDEATQCDIAASLPILQRAKRVVITGDPKQLRHISFLSGAVQRKLQSKHLITEEVEGNSGNLDYRRLSILDVVSNQIAKQEHVSFLNEHYRSTPAIIRFSNQEIYKNALHIMTEKPDIPYNQGLRLVQCRGIRESNGSNKEEAKQIINTIKELYISEKELNKSSCQSIGILSPFRNQVEFIKKLVLKELNDEILEKHNILIGTAYEFQGEERDIMMISFSLDNNSHAMAFHHLNKPDVFNVSITRARSEQVIFCSFNHVNLPTGNLVKKYISQIKSDLSNEPQRSVDKDMFLNEVAEVLTSKGLKTWKGYQIAGLKIDLVFQKNEKTFGIDLIGYPGEFADAFTLERYKILRRAKLPIIPIAYSSWVFQKEACINAIQAVYS